MFCSTVRSGISESSWNTAEMPASCAALGSVASGADGLQLWICVRPSGGAIAKVHANDWLTAKAPGGTLNVYPMTDTVTGLAAGSYDVGLCGADPTPTGWNTLDQASTSYQLYGAGTAAQS